MSLRSTPCAPGCSRTVDHRLDRHVVEDPGHEAVLHEVLVLRPVGPAGDVGIERRAPEVAGLVEALGGHEQRHADDRDQQAGEQSPAAPAVDRRLGTDAAREPPKSDGDDDDDGSPARSRETGTMPIRKSRSWRKSTSAGETGSARTRSLATLTAPSTRERFSVSASANQVRPLTAQISTRTTHTTAVAASFPSSARPARNTWLVETYADSDLPTKVDTLRMYTHRNAQSTLIDVHSSTRRATAGRAVEGERSSPLCRRAPVVSGRSVPWIPPESPSDVRREPPSRGPLIGKWG